MSRFFSAGEELLVESDEAQKGAFVINNVVSWKEIAAFLHEELLKIDPLFSEMNVPISKRKSKAFDLICGGSLKFPDVEAFRQSTARGAFQIIIEDWYRDRYGDAADEDRDSVFVSMVLVHGTPFAMRVPTIFTTLSDEPSTVWIGFPASVQAEENPLGWIESRGLIGGLSDNELDVLRETALETANLIRSISFDVRSLENDEDNLSIVKLAGSVRADLQNGARNLCERGNEANLRSAAWEASQATEKALKLLIHRKGQAPPPNHKLSELADKAEKLGAETIDCEKLALILSGKEAPKIRYEGDMTLAKAAAAYDAALSIIRKVVFEAKPDTKLNIREGRIKIRRPPWFDFDINAFSEKLRS